MIQVSPCVALRLEDGQIFGIDCCNVITNPYEGEWMLKLDFYIIVHEKSLLYLKARDMFTKFIAEQWIQVKSITSLTSPGRKKTRGASSSLILFLGPCTASRRFRFSSRSINVLALMKDTVNPEVRQRIECN